MLLLLGRGQNIVITEDLTGSDQSYTPCLLTSGKHVNIVLGQNNNIAMDVLIGSDQSYTQ